MMPPTFGHDYLVSVLKNFADWQNLEENWLETRDLGMTEIDQMVELAQDLQLIEPLLGLLVEGV